ncbi:hypothetical protein BD770DRAFT_462689 [Pilaira anomala]|nr:hypothetical protein BD770DRAFT_462689 [Pilaira anomala]
MAFIHRVSKRISKKKKHRAMLLKDFVLTPKKRSKRRTHSKLAELRVKFYIADDLNFNNNVNITYLDADLDTIMTDACITDDVIMEEVWQQQEDDMMIIDDEDSEYRYQVDILHATRRYNEFNEDDQSEERSLKLFILLESFYENSINLTEADIRPVSEDTPFDSTELDIFIA